MTWNGRPARASTVVPASGGGGAGPAGAGLGLLTAVTGPAVRAGRRAVGRRSPCRPGPRPQPDGQPAARGCRPPRGHPGRPADLRTGRGSGELVLLRAADRGASSGCWRPWRMWRHRWRPPGAEPAVVEVDVGHQGRPGRRDRGGRRPRSSPRSTVAGPATASSPAGTGSRSIVAAAGLAPRASETSAELVDAAAGWPSTSTRGAVSGWRRSTGRPGSPTTTLGEDRRARGASRPCGRSTQDLRAPGACRDEPATALAARVAGGSWPALACWRWSRSPVARRHAAPADRARGRPPAGRSWLLRRRGRPDRPAELGPPDDRAGPAARPGRPLVGAARRAREPPDARRPTTRCSGRWSRSPTSGCWPGTA